MTHTLFLIIPSVQTTASLLRTRCGGLLTSAGTIAAVTNPLFVQRLHFDILIARQDAAHPKEQERPRLAQLAARRFHALGNLEHRRLVGAGIVDHLRQTRLELVEGFFLAFQRWLERLEDLLETRYLRGGQGQFFLKLVVLPPLEALR